MKKILVPVDFSEHSEYALDVAAQLAKKYSASIVALHMMGMSEAVLTRDDSNEVMEAMFYMKLAEKRFAEFLDRPYLEGLDVETTVQNYKVFKEMDRVAEEVGADLIVMGSHGASGMKEVFVGSNTEKVVRTATVPVLVIKNKAGDFSVDKMVFASDFSLEYYPAYEKARDIAELFDCELKLLFVNTPDGFRKTSDMEARAYQFLSGGQQADLDRFEKVVYYNDNTIEDGIFSYSNRNQADMIAIPTHGRRGLAHFFTGSIGEEVVNHSDIPVITFKI